MPAREDSGLYRKGKGKEAKLSYMGRIVTEDRNGLIVGASVSERVRHAGYAISQRKRVEEPFGWMNTYGLLNKLRHRGRENVDWLFRMTATAYSITRLKGLMA